MKTITLQKSLAAIAVAFIVCAVYASVAYAAFSLITIVAPDGGEEWRGTQEITWSTDGPGTDLVDIVYSDDNFTTQSIIATDVLDSGSYFWDTTSTVFGDPGTAYKVRVQDAATGLIFAASTATFTVDNEDPTTSAAVSPASANGDNGWYVTVPSVTLSCSDGTGSGCDTTYYDWDNSSPASVYAAPISPAEGEHTLYFYSEDQAVDKDAVHNAEAVQSVTYKVDTTAPTGSGSYSQSVAKAGDVVTITVDFSEELQDSPGVQIALSGANTLSATNMTKVSTTQYTYNHTVGAGDGLVTIALSTGKDVAGNVITSAPTAGATFTVDNTAPVVAEVTAVPALTNDTTPDFTFSTTEAGTISYPGTCSSATTVATSGNNTITFDTLADGSYSGCTVVVTDAVGNASSALTATTFVIDTTGPTVDAGSDKEISTAIGTQNASASDANGISSYLWSNETPGVGTITFLTGTSEDTQITGYVDGVYTIRLTVTDNAGNSAYDEMTYVYDTTAPVISTVTAIANPTNNNAPSFEFNVDSVEHGLSGWPGGSIVYGGSCTTPTLTTAVNGDNTITYPALADGTYSNCTLQITDAATNSSSVFTVPTFEVDTVVATVSSIVSKDSDTNGSVDTVELTFTDEVDDSTFNPADFAIGTTTATAIVTGTDDDNTFSLTFGTEIEGTGAVTLVYSGLSSTDLAGNTIATFSTAATDEAKPVLLRARSITTTSVEAYFSEDLNGTTVNASGNEFGFVGYNTLVATESAAGVITLTTDTLAPDATPQLTYTQVDSLQDLAAAPNTAVTPRSVIVEDGLAPQLTSVSIESDNTKDTSLAKSGDTATLSFTSDEEIATPTVTIQGQSAAVTNPSGNDWEATYTFGGADTEGAVTFTIDFDDVATPSANSGTQVTTVTDLTTLTYDRTAPAVDTGSDKVVNALVSQDATTSDSGVGIDTWDWTNETPGVGTIIFSAGNAEDTDISADTDGTYTLRLTVEDLAGNSAYDEMTFTWDTVNPEPLTSQPTNNEEGVAIAAGTATVTFDENVVLLDSSRVLLVNNASSASYKGSVAVDGGNGASAILNIDYTGLEYGTKYRINVKPHALGDVAGNDVLTNFISYFTTEIDLEAPIVTSFNVSGIAVDAATLNVTTNEAATCAFSTTDEAYGSMTGFASTGGTSHSNALSGLSEDTGYDYYVRCADTTAQTNEMSTSAHASFTTLAPDTTGPVISNIQATSIATTSATITWTTDENATSRVEYGPTSGYGTFTALDATADNTSHSVALSSLTDGTEYHFRVISVDGDSNSSTSNDNTFTTEAAPDTTAPGVPTITTAATTVDADTYTIAGTVADDGDTRIVTVLNNAAEVGTVSVPAGSTTWSLLVALTQDTTNSFTATATDTVGNESAESTAVVITEATATGDTDAPADPVIDTTDTTVDADTYEISGTAGADTPSDGARTITVYNNGSVVGSLVLPTGDTAWSFVAALLQDATNSFTAYSTDASGNTSGVSNTVVITEETAADTTAPDVPVITTVAATVDADTTTLSGTAADDGGPRLIRIFNNATLVETTSVPTGETTWSALVALTQDVANAFTATAVDEAGNESAESVAVTITEETQADTTPPTITLLGENPLTLTVGDTYTDPGATASDAVDGDISSSIVVGGDTVDTNTAGTYYVTYNVADAAGNDAAEETRTVIIEAAFDDTASLAVTGIATTKSYATNDDTYANGWSWTFSVTVPTSETEFAMKFSDFVSGANSIAAANNIRFYSAQASANADDSNAVEITAANTYSSTISLDADLDSSTAGRQIEVVVQMKVPTGSAAGSYSGSYGVTSNTP